MRAPISVIIPTLNAGPSLARCLGALGEGLEAGLIRELIISDAKSHDLTHTIAQEAGAVLLTGEQGRGLQVARGATAAKGAWLLILHADTMLEEGWSKAVYQHLNTHPEQAGFFKLAFDCGGLAPRTVAWWANFRSRLFGLPYGDQGLLVSSKVLAQVGGYPELPLMEDVTVARRLKGRLRGLPAIARTSAAKYETEGWLRRGSKNLWLLLRFFCGADVGRLAQRYQRSGRQS